jgi:hypothetical protein
MLLQLCAYRSSVFICRGITEVAHDRDTPAAKLRRAFVTLGLVQDECSGEDIRAAYISLAKRYHPDSGTKEADTDRFITVSTLFQFPVEDTLAVCTDCNLSVPR